MPSHYDHLRRRREYEESLRQNNEAAKEKIAEIAKHPETKLIRRDDMPDPWVFVEQLFPRIAPTIATTVVYKNENTAFCKNIGVPPEAGGLFFIKASAILLCYNKEKFKDDVVICHEMLHYASQLLGGKMQTSNIEEDFAYFKSIPYLSLHGYSDKWIAEQYMLPHYWGREYHRLAKEGAKDAKEKGRELGLEICFKAIEAELRGPVVPKDNDNEDRFDVI